MAGVANFLSMFGGQSLPSAASFAPGAEQPGSGLRNPFGGQQAQDAAPAPAKRSGGLAAFLGEPFAGTRDTLGQVGDFLLQANGLGPLYAPRKEAHQADEAMRQASAVRQFLGDWLTNPDDPERWRNALLADPEQALDLRSKLEGDPYTLGEGQVRYRGDQEVARGPDKAPEVTVIDGIAYDRRTGTPLFESPYPRIIAGQDGAFFEQPRIGLGRTAGPAPQAPQAPPPRPQGMTDDQIWAQAHEAVRNGANVEEVFRRLQAWGLNP